jgi:hypothetical protein
VPPALAQAEEVWSEQLPVWQQAPTTTAGV